MQTINTKQAQEIIDKFIDGVSIKNLAIEYNICESNVNMILKGVTWKQCKRPSNMIELLSCAKLNKQQAQEIINKFVDGISIKKLANVYNVSIGTITNIIKGSTKYYKSCIRPININELFAQQISEQQSQEIINKFTAGYTNAELSLEYNIWGTTIGNILRGDSWKNCKRPNNIQELINKQHKGTPYKDLPPLTELQKDILVGSLLGDGSLGKTKSDRANSGFAKTQMHTRKAYLEWHMRVFSDYSHPLQTIFSKEKLSVENGKIVRSPAPKRLSAYTFYTYHHPNFTELRKKWYPEGVKVVPKDLILNPQRIAIWFFDDGSNNSKQRSAVICTNAFILEDVEFLSYKLNEFNIFPTIIMQRKAPVLKFHASSYDNLISLIKPYMLWDCFAYKTEWRPAKQQWEISGKFTEGEAKHIIELRKIKSAKEIAKQFNVHVNTIYAVVSGRSWKHLHG